MKFEYPYTPKSDKGSEQIAPPPSRFIDEKISDATGTDELTPTGRKV